LSFGEQGVKVEEATSHSLIAPRNSSAIKWVMRAAFGKVNPIHNHSLDYIDRPLRPGISVRAKWNLRWRVFPLSRFLGPKTLFSSKVTAQVSGRFWQSDHARFPSHDKKRLSVSVGHFAAVTRILSESTNLDIGCSYARGTTIRRCLSDEPVSDGSTFGRGMPLRRALQCPHVAKRVLLTSRVSPQPRLPEQARVFV